MQSDQKTEEEELEQVKQIEIFLKFILIEKKLLYQEFNMMSRNKSMLFIINKKQKVRKVDLSAHQSAH